MESTRLTGDDAEDLALAYLIAHHHRLVERNYHCRWGEIDLIMQDQDTLVFVEVRYRKNNSFGGALASVSKIKQGRLSKAALHYLSQIENGLNTPCRFDVVAFDRSSVIQLKRLTKTVNTTSLYGASEVPILATREHRLGSQSNARPEPAESGLDSEQHRPQWLKHAFDLDPGAEN